MSWALTYYIFDRRKIKYLLPDQQALGAHTDIIQFHDGATTIFRWTHAGARPMGVGINKQCPRCKRLKTRSPKQLANKAYFKMVILRCSGCKEETVYELPPEWNWVHKPASKGEERGAWIFRTHVARVQAQPSSMDTT